jgi:hypothetical protein
VGFPKNNWNSLSIFPSSISHFKKNAGNPQIITVTIISTLSFSGKKGDIKQREEDESDYDEVID